MSPFQRFFFVIALGIVVLVGCVLVGLLWRRRAWSGARSFLVPVVGGMVWALGDALNLLIPARVWVTIPVVATNEGHHWMWENVAREGGVQVVYGLWHTISAGRCWRIRAGRGSWSSPSSCVPWSRGCARRFAGEKLVDFVPKPYTKDQLAIKLESILR
jgi:hypothetical protein